MILHPMTVDRALQINGRLVEAWMVREGIRSGPMTGLRGIRLADALDATTILAGCNGPVGDRVDVSSLSRLFAWMLVQSQMS